MTRQGDGDGGAGPPYPEALRARMSSLEAARDEHEKLRERIAGLEESLQRLGRESLERAKVGMDKLADKYFPKVKQYEGLEYWQTTPAVNGRPMPVRVMAPTLPVSGVQPFPTAALRTSVSPIRTTIVSPRGPVPGSPPSPPRVLQPVA